MRLLRHVAVLFLLFIAGCAQLRSLIPSRAPAERLAAGVTIMRDEWGVPHILGDSDASVAFGLAYAQAEDDLWQIEEDYLHALGRASHWHGERYLVADLVKAAFEVERLSREEYEREPADRRAIWDAFAAGLNHYIGTSGERPRLITCYEPWMMFALLRSIDAGTIIDGVQLGVAVEDDGRGGHLIGTWVDSAAQPVAPTVMWAVAPVRTASGHALLLHHDAGDFSGRARPYEMMLLSEAGWHVRGFATLGTPVPRGGHNTRLAWSQTPSGADHADVYEVAFDDPAAPLMYRFDGGWRAAVEWEDTLLINSPAGVVQRVFRFRRTHHGPVVAERDGRALAVRVARMEEGGALQQLYAMSRALEVEEFRAALDNRALASSTMVAAVGGSIYYLHGNAVPVRDTSLDWTRPVDGAALAAEWRGYHSIGDLPQVFNPASGWIQSGGSASAPGDSPDPAAFPRYMATTADDSRARASRRLLQQDSAWTFETWAAAAFDTHLLDAAEHVLSLAAEWEQVGGLSPSRARRLDEAVELLRSWDAEASAESEAATLYVLWQERLRTSGYSGELAQFRAMEDVIARLEHDWSTAIVPWGEVNRLQRVRARDDEPFSDDRVSLPVGGAPAWAGSVFTVNAREEQGPRRRYAVDGTRWIGAMELAPGIRMQSVVPFGQSGDPGSAHWFDQAALYAAGRLKETRFDRGAIMAAARRTYRPLDAAVRELP